MRRFAPLVSSRPRVLSGLTALGILATAALLAQPNNATAAQPAADTPQTTVYYSFRDLATDRSAQALYQRIVSAARAVCPEYDQRNLEESAYSRACQREAVTRAIRQIGNARLAALHSHKLTRHG